MVWLCGIVNSAIQALARQDADLDLDHVEPACVFGGVVELEPSQNPHGVSWRERLIQGAGGMGRQIILDEPDDLASG
jgi:hypothetical protein